MHILVCLDGRLGQGGSGIYGYEFSKALVSLGHSIKIFAPSTTTTVRSHKNRFFEVVELPSSAIPAASSLVYGWNAWKELSSLIRNDSVEAVSFNNITGLVTYLFHRMNLPVHMWTISHGVIKATKETIRMSSCKVAGGRPYLPLRDILGSYVSRSAEKVNFALSPMIIANSNHTKRSIEEHYEVAGDKIAVAYGGVDHRKFKALQDGSAQMVSYNRKRLNLRKYVVLYIGDFSYLKGVYHLALAARRIVRRVHNVSFLFVGGYDADRLGDLVTFVKQLGIGDYVRIVGFVPHSKIPYYYSIADLCVIPSLYEAFGLTAIEAMACGKPVVASKTGGLAEIVGDEHGILVEPGKPIALANSILKLIEDEDLRDTVGRNGYFHSLSFSWERTAKQILDYTIRPRNKIK